MMICSPVTLRRRVLPTADVLHRAAHVPHLKRIANGERLVERDGHGGEQIAEQRLHGKRDGDATDAWACQQRPTAFQRNSVVQSSRRDCIGADRQERGRDDTRGPRDYSLSSSP
jgi:hypothetical protein